MPISESLSGNQTAVGLSEKNRQRGLALNCHKTNVPSAQTSMFISRRQLLLTSHKGMAYLPNNNQGKKQGKFIHKLVIIDQLVYRNR